MDSAPWGQRMERQIKVMKFRHVLFKTLYNVSEESTVSIFMVEEQARMQEGRKQLKAQNVCLAYYSRLKMEKVRSSEKSMNYKTTRCYILQDSILQHKFNLLKPSGHYMYHML
jgi:hypothetical protein